MEQEYGLMAVENVTHKDPSFLKSFIAGAMGGVALLYVGHPLDTIKVRLQTMPQPLPGQPAMYTSTFDCIYKTVKKEGVRGMYRGLLSPLAGITPMYALYFLGYSVGKRLQFNDTEDNLRMPQYFIAGMMAGLFALPVTASVERVKCVMQLQQGSKSQSKYSSSWDCARQLYRHGGVINLYQGTMATMLRDLPIGGIFFMTYEWILQSLTTEGKSRRDLNPLKIIIAGGVAGSLCVVAIPIDTLKSRYQTGSKEHYPNGIRSVFKELMQKEGILVIFRGFTPYFLRAFPANAACFLGYEVTVKALNYLFPSL